MRLSNELSFSKVNDIHGLTLPDAGQTLRLLNKARGFENTTKPSNPHSDLRRFLDMASPAKPCELYILRSLGEVAAMVCTANHNTLLEVHALARNDKERFEGMGGVALSTVIRLAEESTGIQKVGLFCLPELVEYYTRLGFGLDDEVNSDLPDDSRYLRMTREIPRATEYSNDERLAA